MTRLKRAWNRIIDGAHDVESFLFDEHLWLGVIVLFGALLFCSVGAVLLTRTSSGDRVAECVAACKAEDLVMREVVVIGDEHCSCEVRR